MSLFDLIDNIWSFHKFILSSGEVTNQSTNKPNVIFPFGDIILVDGYDKLRGCEREALLFSW